MAFTHLHVHTEYSLLDGACRIKPLLEKVRGLGQSACAITDHGVMYGAVEFYKMALDMGIKPIIGCEVYVAPRSRLDKVHGVDSERFHLILLCENNTGYSNLIKIVSEAWTSGFYTKPRVDLELLEQYHEGIIALSGCMFGEVSQALGRNDYDEAKTVALRYRDIFGEGNYFLEIQNHDLIEQQRINPLLIRLSDETGIPLVATNDCHYIEKEDSKVQKVLVCIQTNHTLDEDTGLDFNSQELYVKSEDEMLLAFSFCPQAVLNTQIISDRCNVSFEFGNTKLPHFDVPEGFTHNEWFESMCHKGFAKRYGDNPPQQYIDRLNYEIEIIEKMGYVDYYLIVHDFIKYAKSKGIPVGPGRGSGAASICAYSIGITGIDPMKYNLLFERFLNPERVSMPDFDVDFCYVRRQEVIDYVNEKYGTDHVAQIVTFNTLAARAVIRDVGRVLGISYSVVDSVAKLIPRDNDITLENVLETSAEFKELCTSSAQMQELINIAIKIEGMPRNTSTHAAGVVITHDPVVSYVPLSLNDDTIVTQYTMVTLEQLGLLKMDFLGLRTLTVIDETVKSIRRNRPDFDINRINYEDKSVFEMMTKAQTDGVFQFESAGMRSVLSSVRPKSIEDMIAVISLYRPGPVKSIPKFVENRNNPNKITYAVPALKNILNVTNGCIVYQEQVMQICRELAGYSYGRADLVRRAMAKKKHTEMMKEREIFIHGLTDDNGNVIVDGAIRRGVDEKTADEIFEQMAAFASYAFNKAHAAAYAYVAYQTAWLKCHYPCEFLAAMLTSFLERSDKINDYIAECKHLGIEVLPPDVNMGYTGFRADSGKICFGLLAIKNLGEGFIERIVQERTLNGEFTSFYNFCRRMQGKDFNRRAVESLIKAGALDSVCSNRRSMLLALPVVLEELENSRRRNVEGQIGFFDLLSSGNEDGIQPSDEGFEMTIVDDFPHQVRLKYEKEVAGLYLSGHPLMTYSQVIRQLKTTYISELLSEGEQSDSIKDKNNVSVFCMITDIKKKITRDNNSMAFLTVEDLTGSLEVIAFPRIFSAYQHLIYEGSIVIVHGRINLREDEDAKIVADVIESCPAVSDEGVAQEKAKHHKKQRQGLFLKFDMASSPQIAECEKYLAIFDGRVPLYYYFADRNEYKQFSETRAVDVNPVLLRELRKILGDNNVIYNE